MKKFKKYLNEYWVLLIVYLFGLMMLYFTIGIKGTVAAVVATFLCALPFVMLYISLRPASKALYELIEVYKKHIENK